MQDDDERDRAEQEQCRHQNQPHDQEVKPTPGWIFGARIDHDRRRRVHRPARSAFREEA